MILTYIKLLRITLYKAVFLSILTSLLDKIRTNLAKEHLVGFSPKKNSAFRSYIIAIFSYIQITYILQLEALMGSESASCCYTSIYRNLVSPTLIKWTCLTLYTNIKSLQNNSRHILRYTLK